MLILPTNFIEQSFSTTTTTSEKNIITQANAHRIITFNPLRFLCLPHCTKIRVLCLPKKLAANCFAHSKHELTKHTHKKRVIVMHCRKSNPEQLQIPEHMPHSLSLLICSSFVDENIKHKYINLADRPRRFCALIRLQCAVFCVSKHRLIDCLPSIMKHKRTNMVLWWQLMCLFVRLIRYGIGWIWLCELILYMVCVASACLVCVECK